MVRFLGTNSQNQQVAIENIDEQLKVSICSILTTASEETVNGIIHALKHAGLESLSDLQFVQEDDLILVLKPIQRRKLVKAWSDQSSNEKNSAVATSVPSNTFALQNTSKITNPAVTSYRYFPFYSNDNFASRIATSVSSNTFASQNASIITNPVVTPRAFLPFCSNDNNLASSVATSISSNIFASQNTGITTNPIVTLNPYLPSCSLNSTTKSDHAQRKATKNLTPRLKAQLLDNFLKLPSESPSQSCKWKRKKCLTLLQVYAEYKKELSTCSDKDKFKIWTQIAQEVQQRCSINCNELQCQIKIEELRRHYHEVKKQNVMSEKWIVFLSEANKAFGDAKNLVIVPAKPENILSSKADGWTKQMSLMLLQAYAKYKTQFSHPNIEEQEVWKKIAEEFRIMSSMSFDEFQCCSKIDELRQEYEKFKNVVVTKRPDAVYLDKARKYFENAENQSLSSEKSNNKHLKSSKKRLFRRSLLEAYLKYKMEFASPDNDERMKAWKKIATELREKELYDCGESICRFEIFQLKCLYEDCKIRKDNKPWFFEGAKKAFENTENLDASNYEVDKAENKIGKYIPPHLRNAENKLNGSAISPKTIDTTCVVKVSNLSDDVRVSDLQELFMPYGKIANLYTIKNESDESKRFAYVTFLNQEDATQAIHAVDGVEFNELTLKVEWG